MVRAMLGSRRRALTSGAVLGVAALALCTLGFVYQGVPTDNVQLDDGGVWVTRTSDLLVGHLNYPSRQLDGAVRATGAGFDVQQDGNDVLLTDEGAHTIAAVDPAKVVIGGPVTLPSSSDVALGGTTVAVVGAGRLFAASFDQLAGQTFDKRSALTDVPGGGAVAASKDGAWVFAVSTTKPSIVSVHIGDGSNAVARTPLQGVADDAHLSIAAVGDAPVVFDSTHGIVYLADGSRHPIPGAASGASAGAALQQSSADGDSAYIATASGLVRQPLDGGQAQRVAKVADGTPSAPVWLNGCAYAVWSGSGALVRECAGGAGGLNTTIASTSSAKLVLRTNRRVVVVNDTEGGTVWLVDKSVQSVDNWQDVIPPSTDNGNQDQSDKQEQQFQLPPRSAVDHKPHAVDHTYGVRPGRTTILPVTDGCTDPDGDLLTASAASALPSGYAAAPVLQGSALQVTVPADASGSVSFRYRVDDGRGMSDEATVTLTVHQPGEVGTPQQPDGPKTIHVEAGASVGYNALDGWRDSFGDDIYLAGASVTGGDTVTFRNSGEVVFTASSGQTGVKTVKLTVSNGRNHADGVLYVDVQPKGSLAPVANSDRATATAGVPITISPLANDLSLNGQPLRLAKIDAPAGVTATPDYTAGTLQFEAAQPGDYYVQYLVATGTTAAPGLIRIHVVPASTSSTPPVAARALAMLPVGGSVLVDPLANDTDPDGGILVLQSVQVPSGLGVSAQVLEHSVVRVTDLGQLSEPVTFTYVVSNGSSSAIGEIAVMPVPVDANVAPVAVPDTATVQVGQVVNIPVLANDYDPGNGTFTLAGTLGDLNLGKGDVAFVSGPQVRFQAGAQAGTATFTYRITDAHQQTASALVTVHVLGADAARQAPKPQAVTARVIAGDTVRIPIPLDGIDPDGSTVQLAGVTTSPQKGTATVGDTWITYTADPPATGTDTFTYRVRDFLGQEADGTVSVGIAAPGATPGQPYAAPDAVTARPGRTVAVDVLANDSDPSGSPISLVADKLTVPNGISASVQAGRVVVKTPQAAGTFALAYTIANAYGMTAQGRLIVTVAADAPLLPPTARDDYISPAQVGRDLKILVPVLANDDDPDGTPADLTVAVPGGQAAVVGQSVQVTIGTAPQIIRYTVTDPDGLTGQAFVYVPGLSTLVPTLTSTAPIVVKSGEKASIPLSRYVTVRDGRTPRIATASSVRTGHSDGSNPVVDATTLQYTSASGYYGSDSLGVLVTDGTGPDDPKGLSAYVMIPITVVPATNIAPTMRSTTVTVGQGEAPVSVDLSLLSYDPNPGDQAKLSYAVDGSVPNGLQARTAGATLTISADASTRPDTTAAVTVKATDPAGGTGAGTITVDVVKSTRPLPIAVDLAVPNAEQGKTVVVDPLAVDSNPFAADGKPLSLVGVAVASGQGTAAVQSGKVAITPGASFFGTMVVAYTIADATNSVSRQATGHITVTVAGKPSAPTVPAVVAFASHTVTLSWQAPASNGSPITGYALSWSGGASGSQQCPSTTCTVTGLANAVPYTFTVVAVNAVGSSPASGPSAQVIPDSIPDAPSAPSVVFGDASLALSWTAPHSDGSPVTSYNVQISPAPPSGAAMRTAVSGSSLTWTGLQNGVSYQVQVQAVNRAGSSAWSPWSIGVTPAGVPDAPTGVKASFAPSVGSQAQISVSWNAPMNDNGDAVQSYTVTQTGGDGQGRTQTVTGTSATFSVGTSTNGYSFTVTAKNKAGSSVPSAASAPVRAANAPDAPSSVSIAATGVAGQFKVTITPGAWNGNAPGDVTWMWTGTASGSISVQSQSTTSVVGLINGAANGQVQAVQVWGRSNITGGDGAKTGSNQAKPWGPLLGYTPSAAANGSQECFTWNVSGALDGQQFSSLTYSAQGGQSGSGGVTGTACSGSAYYTTFGFTMTVHTAEGNSATYTASGSTGANPGRWANLTQGTQYVGPVGTGTCTASAPGCYYFHVKLGGFPPNSQVSIACFDDQSGTPWTSHSFGTDGAGNLDVQTCPIGSTTVNTWKGPYYFTATDQYGSMPSNTTSW